MKKNIPVSVVVLIILIVLGICGYVYTKIPTEPKLPPMKKGQNRPPPGTRQHKNDSAKKKAATTNAPTKTADPTKPDPTKSDPTKVDSGKTGSTGN